MATRKVEKSITGTGVTFTYADGSKTEVDPSSFPKEIQKALLLHGISQKLGDSYAGEDADKCQAVVDGLVKRMQEGEWTSRQASGTPKISQLVMALVRVTGQDEAACTEKLASMDDDGKKAIKNHPQIKAAIAEIKLEKAQAEAKKAADEAGDGEGAGDFVL